MSLFVAVRRMLSGLSLIAAALIPLGCQESPAPAAARHPKPSVSLPDRSASPRRWRRWSTGASVPPARSRPRSRSCWAPRSRAGIARDPRGPRHPREAGRRSVARLDPTDFQLRVDQAVARLQQARARLGLPAEGADDRVDPEKTSARPPGPGGARRGAAHPRADEQLWEQQFIARAAARHRGVGRSRWPRAATRTRSRRCGTARASSCSGAPSSSWPGSSSPTP